MSRVRAQRLTAVLAAGLLAISVAGCSNAADAPEQTASPDAQSSAPADTQTPTPSATEAEGIEGWTIEQAGIGPFDIGMRYADALTENDATVTETCTGVASVESGEGAVDMWLLATDNDPEGTVSEISVSVTADGAAEHAGNGPLTEEGIGLGSSVDELTSAYPDVRELDDTGVPNRSMYYLQGDEGGGLIFTTQSGDDVIWSISVTTGETPAYEPCA